MSETSGPYSAPQSKDKSIAVQLLRIVFGLYCLVAVAVTAVHIEEEYRYTKDAIRSELSSYERIFGPVLAKAMWDLDREQIHDIVLGMAEVPVIAGIKIELLNRGQRSLISGMGYIADEHGMALNVSQDGSISAADESRLETFFSYEFPVLFRFLDKEQQVGVATLYSSSNSVLERVRVGFIFLVVNAFIKGVALWLIFLWVSRRLLIKPLRKLTHAISTLRFDNLEAFDTEPQLKGNNELVMIERAFCETVEALAAAKREIIEMNLELETKVELRTADLVLAKTRAEESERAKSEFLANMSHEIRTPMNGVLGMLSLLQEDKLDEAASKKVDVAKSSAEALLVLINDILDFSKVDANKLELDEVEFDLVKLLGELCKSFAPEAEKKGILLTLDTSELPVTHIKADPLRIRQIVSNLLGNAIKFCEQGEVLVAIKLHQPAIGWQLECRVKDTGIGIAADKLQSLFDPFVQVDASMTRKYGGTGLGLSIVKCLVELMGGEVTATSEPGVGSEFKCTFWVGRVEPPTQARVELDGRHILLILAHSQSRAALAKQLRIWGASVAEAGDLQSARELLGPIPSKASEISPDTAIVDAELLSEELYEQLQRGAKGVKLVVSKSVTGSENPVPGAATELPGFTRPPSIYDLISCLTHESADAESLDSADQLGVASSVDEETPAPVWPADFRILVVDDNQVNRLVAQGMLLVLGLQADYAADGQEAIDLLTKNDSDQPYTLLLMDCQMPVMDGYEATKQIRNGAAGDAYRGVKIIAMTANAMEGDREKCIAAGMDSYLAKPIEGEALREVLTNLLLAE